MRLSIHFMPEYRQQKGVALIFVLMLFAIMSSLAVTIVLQLHNNTLKHKHYIQYSQAKHYALGAEDHIAVLLEDDKAKDINQNKIIDHWHEDWASTSINFPIKDGSLSITVLDEQGRFNLNQLADLKEIALKNVFIRILENLDISIQVADKIQRWITPDSISTDNSDNYLYYTSTPPYRSGNTLLTHISELKLLKILDDNEYQRLLPFVSAIPNTKAGLNINTIPKEIFQALSANFTEEDADRIIKLRGNEGFNSMDIIMSDPGIRAKLPSKPQLDALQVKLFSHYFSVYTKVAYRDITLHMHSMLSRNDQGKVTVIYRELGYTPKWVTIVRNSAR